MHGDVRQGHAQPAAFRPSARPQRRCNVHWQQPGAGGLCCERMPAALRLRLEPLGPVWRVLPLLWGRLDGPGALREGWPQAQRGALRRAAPAGRWLQRARVPRHPGAGCPRPKRLADKVAALQQVYGRSSVGQEAPGVSGPLVAWGAALCQGQVRGCSFSRHDPDDNVAGGVAHAKRSSRPTRPPWQDRGQGPARPEGARWHERQARRRWPARPAGPTGAAGANRPAFGAPAEDPLCLERLGRLAGLQPDMWHQGHTAEGALRADLPAERRQVVQGKQLVAS
mmetsp:Transcript_14336/g.45099  ORF Transcript_14336/g.45099 Transcript_14336/m.45099 type:complete len:282 (+) Transcript_14336:267-1112(+)